MWQQTTTIEITTGVKPMRKSLSLPLFLFEIELATSLKRLEPAKGNR